MNDCQTKTCGTRTLGDMADPYATNRAIRGAAEEKAAFMRQQGLATASIGQQIGAAAAGCEIASPSVRVSVDVPAYNGFSAAFEACLYKHAKITRASWNGPNQHVQCQHPDENSKMSTSYLYLTDVRGQRVPWVPSQGDLFARDWAILP